MSDTKQPAEKIERRSISAEHKFTDAERLDIATQLAEKVAERGRLEESKKNLTSQMKSEIDGVKSEIDLLSQKINTGKEFRDFFCRVEKDYETKMKYFYDDLTGNLIKKEQMTAHDLQVKLNLDEEDNDGETNTPQAPLGDDATLTEIVRHKFSAELSSRIVDMHSNNDIDLGCAIPEEDSDEYEDEIADRDDCATEVTDTILIALSDVEKDAAEFLAITGFPIGEFHRRLQHGDSLAQAVSMLTTYSEAENTVTITEGVLDFFWPNRLETEYPKFAEDVTEIIETLAIQAAAELGEDAEPTNENEGSNESSEAADPTAADPAAFEENVAMPMSQAAIPY